MHNNIRIIKSNEWEMVINLSANGGIWLII